MNDTAFRIIHFIREWNEDHTHSPTVREIMDGVGVYSTQTVAYWLNILERDGKIIREERKARTVRVVPEALGVVMDETPLTFTEYQDRAWETALPSAQRLEYLLPALAAETGELMDVFAKQVRDADGAFGPVEEDRIVKEAGDVLWELACTLRKMGIRLEDVARANLRKLADRQARGALGGSGDER